MENYQVINAHGREHVLTSRERNANYNCKIENPKQRGKFIQFTDPMPEPNYMGTGLALCGVLKKGETLSQWENRRTEWRKKQ